ncbi:cyclic nucleotide-binding domain-containing protein [Actinacidiphila acidipaludis]|uniref:Cyclic nucleotide-binding domain-containing protein n=1 Tax=Actinacidiphila acidipaludis TaxID=2873382 RepID=A0ABS7Q2G1_9ACTN|nr:cyclic nucleotide-binding domain-containing protein [Streptomyces acidipaludis]MBY8876257.1 cyclic nucleotide-binding domain-containing protein [Streptomyces acidipaludis]
MTATARRFLDALPAVYRERLLSFARDRSFTAGSRVFDEDEEAGLFWILRSGRVALDAQVPGRGPVVVETLGPGELLGWSWLFEPFRWHLGAAASEAVEAHEFDAARVRAAIEDDPAFGLAMTRCVASVAIGRRLRACRIRLLDLYGPANGAGRRGPP